MLAGLYACAVEPYWIEVTRHQVAAPVAPALTLAHLSDLHLYGLGRRERALLALLDEARPDLIVITGDSVIDGDFFAPAPGLADDPAYARAAQLLGRLHAPLGVFAVRGNWENLRRLPDERSFWEHHGVRLLVNQAREVRRGLWIAGLDDASNGRPDVEAARLGIPADAFAIALFHSPAAFRSTAGSWPLALAGHTHGGQVRLPPIPTFWLPHGSGDYLAGWYAAKGSRLYVSRGIGTSTLPIRFLCRPELPLLTLGPALRAPALEAGSPP